MLIISAGTLIMIIPGRVSADDRTRASHHDVTRMTVAQQGPALRLNSQAVTAAISYK